MQKEKKVRAYTRKTKSGKTVSVKAHTAKYDAAEEARKAFASKKGAGEEVKEKKSIKQRFDEAAAELASRPDPKDMSDEEVLREMKELSGHWGTSETGYLPYQKRKMRNKDYLKRANKLRDRYNEAVGRQAAAKRRKEDAEKTKAYLSSRGVSDADVRAYAKKVGYKENPDTGEWHFKGSRVGHPYYHVAQKAVALKRKHNRKK